MEVFTFGARKVATPGTPVRLLSDAALEVVKRGVAKIEVQTLPANAGQITVINGPGPADTTDFTNVVRTMDGPHILMELYGGFNGLDLADFYIDAETAGEGVTVTAYRF